MTACKELLSSIHRKGIIMNVPHFLNSPIAGIELAFVRTKRVVLELLAVGATFYTNYKYPLKTIIFQG
jgi:hypothetical protein